MVKSTIETYVNWPHLFSRGITLIRIDMGNYRGLLSASQDAPQDIFEDEASDRQPTKVVPLVCTESIALLL
jgi:hypothetical protein